MITVRYRYLKNKAWFEGTKVFDSCYRARKFMWSLKYREDTKLLGYSCEDPEDSEWLSENVSLYEINFGGI